MKNTLTYKGQEIGTVEGERMTVLGTAEALGLDITSEYDNYDVLWNGTEYTRNASFDGQKWYDEVYTWKNGEVVEYKKI